MSGDSFITQQTLQSKKTSLAAKQIRQSTHTAPQVSPSLLFESGVA